MLLFICAIVFSVNSLAYGSGNQCFQQEKLPNMVRNSELRHPPFKSVTSLGPVDCARQCKLHTLCYFVNFNIQTLNCALITTHEFPESITNPMSVMIDVKSWNENILQACKNHQCPNNTVCIETNTDFECKPIGCAGLPQVQNINVTSFISKDLWEFGAVIEYACSRGYYSTKNVTCTLHGSWSDAQCTRYRGCLDTTMCSELKETDFWLFLTLFNSLQKVFCKYSSNFATFISIPEYNTASTPIYRRNGNSCELITATNLSAISMGYTDFQKIRFIKANGKILRTKKLFSNSSFNFQEYGRAGDCYAGNDSSVCGVIGHFIINLRGTGFKVSPSVQWKTWGTDGFIDNLTRSDDGSVIEGYCGGNCGGCQPDGDLHLEVDKNYPPPFESAELPICKFPI